MVDFIGCIFHSSGLFSQSVMAFTKIFPVWGKINSQNELTGYSIALRDNLLHEKGTEPGSLMTQ